MFIKYKIFNRKDSERQHSKGVTLIELLLVVSLIGIISAVTVGVVNVSKQKEFAEEANIRSSMVKVCSAIKTYGEAEATTVPSYPDDGDNGNPLDVTATTADIAAFYLDRWPEDFVYTTQAPNSVFSVHVEQSASPGIYWKCTNGWNDIRECTNVSSILSCN